MMPTGYESFFESMGFISSILYAAAQILTWVIGFIFMRKE